VVQCIDTVVHCKLWSRNPKVEPIIRTAIVSILLIEKNVYTLSIL
jgi:hypothetical protein